MPTKKHTCPHCGAELQAFELPEAGGWSEQHHLACFNDDCPYYQRGWDWMLSRYEAKASYRYRLDPVSGCASPIAVWSETALLDRIIKKKGRPTRAADREPAGKTAKKAVKKAPAKKAVKKQKAAGVPARRKKRAE